MMKKFMMFMFCLLTVSTMSMAGITPIADYSFNGDLTNSITDSSIGDAVIVGDINSYYGGYSYEDEIVAGKANTSLHLKLKTGLQVDLSDRMETYTIQMIVKVDDNYNSWNSLIDFAEKERDYGLYLRNAQLFFETGYVANGNVVGFDKYMNIVVVRDGTGETAKMAVYVDGKEAIDIRRDYYHTIDSKLTFLMGNLYTDSRDDCPGYLSDLIIWDTAIADAASLSMVPAREYLTTVPVPSSLLLLGSGMAVISSIRRRISK